VGRQLSAVVYLVAMIALIVCLDVFFLRHQFGLRLGVNIGIVVVFGAFYLRFLNRQ
jgi:hypothetical protein